MKTPRISYQTVAYDLRPHKQVERKMIVDALHLIAEIGFPISEYQYTGMASIFYVDFIMLHKVLGIHEMVSVERYHENKRADFNLPYSGIITIEPGLIGEYLPKLDPLKRHLVWADYDHPLIKSVLHDVKAAISQMKSGSIILITVDLETEQHEVQDPESEEYRKIDLRTPSSRFAHYSEDAGKLFQPDWTVDDFKRGKFHATTTKILLNAIKNGLAGTALTFQELFNFAYADGHSMLTFGGMICDKKDNKLLRNSSLENTRYIRMNIAEQPFKISVPILTRKEKLHLDAAMPNEHWTPSDFILEDYQIKAYREIYRFYPSYTEMLL